MTDHIKEITRLCNEMMQPGWIGCKDIGERGITGQRIYNHADTLAAERSVFREYARYLEDQLLIMRDEDGNMTHSRVGDYRRRAGIPDHWMDED